MADEPTPDAPEMDAPEPDPPAPKAEEPFDGDYDPKRARELIDKLRNQVKELEPAAKKARELEELTKTEQQRLEERAAQAEKAAESTASEVLRLRVALRKGLTESQAKRLIGSTEDEIEADADELLASFTSPGKPGGKPRERLTPGAVPDAEPEEMDPKALAAKVRRF